MRSAVVGAGAERGRARADREVGIAQLRRHRARGLPALARDARARPAAIRRSSSCSRSTSPTSRSKVSSLEIEIRSVETSSGRGSIPRARSRTSRPTLPGQHRASSASSSAARPPIVSTPAAASRAAARGPMPGQHADRERREERRLAARPHDGQPAGLAAVGGDLRDHLRRRDAERAREPRPRPDDRPHRLGERAGVVERRRELAEIEVALVDPGLLDRRHDLADDRPDLARVLPVERPARPHEHGLRAAAQRLGARHRRHDRRTAARRSSRSRPRRGRAGRRRRRAAPAAARGCSSSSTAAKNASRSRWATIGRRRG